MNEFVVADDGDEVVGFAWLSDRGVSIATGARAALAGWGLTGPLRLGWRGWPRQLVEIPMPEGLKLVELQVHPQRRGAGIGSALLEHVIAAAGARPISLTTRSDNPARRLYERHGFVLSAQKSHRAFKRRTGATGRVLMVRSPSRG
jgi:ribosomal protein S18 acetylase RimI-like enzyme